ncbi:uncharacterized protein LOC115399836 [Salarias fasciatus]|uniref:uncharacterized protein LOC115399836 n=1 Tax=Salarias fasciatus TaxID=181472 RepID=UPI001176B590|nr:uncharacterized protein LOC115399836 [Salarias fasciatus]
MESGEPSLSGWSGCVQRRPSDVSPGHTPGMTAGKADAVLDSEVVLTKMKLFRNFNEKLQTSNDSVSTVSTISNGDKDMSDPTTVSREGSHSEDRGRPEAESGSVYLSAIFSKAQLPRLYKFESEDSGVELPSGANSPSTPTGSEQSFVVHSRESSCASGQGPPDPHSLPEQLDPLTQTDTEASGLRQEQFGCSSRPSDRGVHAFKRIQIFRADPQVPQGSGSPTRPGKHCCREACEDAVDNEREGSGAGSDGLDEYMEECCRLSEVQPAMSSPLGSGLGYLEHICQLLEKIGQLQDANLRLQRQICGLQKNGRKARTREDFFQQHCSCGAAGLAFQDLPSRPSPSGTLSDLSTIPEVSHCTGVDGGGLSAVPLWRRSLNRRSYTEGEGFLSGDSEGLLTPPYRLGENGTLGRFRDLLRRSRLRNQSRLGLSSSSLKMSCPQLYRPDPGPEEAAGRNRSSMMSLDLHRTLDVSFLH